MVVKKGTRWSDDNDLPCWVPEGEIPADPLQDLTVQDGKLSLWWIDDGGKNIDRILAAYACKRGELRACHAVLFPEEALNGLGLRIERSPGEIADDDANSLWHRDVVELTALRAARLAARVFLAGQVRVLIESKLEDLIKTGVANGVIRRERITKGIRKRIEDGSGP